MQPSVVIGVHANTDVAAARRSALTLADQGGLDQEEASNVGIVVTEAATNVLKHGGGGDIVLRREGRRIEITALDKGPGTGDTAHCFHDGYTTAHSRGTGLGAVLRLSAFCDFYSVQGEGSVLVAHVGGTGSTGVLNIPYPGEHACGDAWLVQQSPERLRVFVVDGLGHGISASDAAHAAIGVAESNPQTTPAELLQAAHVRLRSTRGAAASVADVSADGRAVQFAGVGNVVGVVAVTAVTRRQMISINGTLGHEARKFQQYGYPLESKSLLVLHTDGLSANWSFEKYPGLFNRHPSVIAAVLFRDFRRVRDDATVVVVRPGDLRR